MIIDLAKPSGIARLVWQLRDYFDKHERNNYSTELNQLTGNSYLHDARRAFVKYYLVEGHYDIENIYKNNQ